MSYTDPNGWDEPRAVNGGPPSNPTFGNTGAVTGDDWTPADGVGDVDLVRIETNIAGLHTLLCQSGTVDVEVNAPYFSAQIVATLRWTKINNIVFLTFPEMESPANVANGELQIDPDTVWPAEILPGDPIIATCVFTKDQNDLAVNRPGYMLIPDINTDPIVCYITDYDGATDTDGCFCTGAEAGYVGFSSGEAGINKAIPLQTISWMTDAPLGAAPGTTTTTTSTTGAP